MYLPSISVFPVRRRWRHQFTCSFMHPHSGLIQATNEAAHRLAFSRKLAVMGYGSMHQACESRRDEIAGLIVS